MSGPSPRTRSQLTWTPGTVAVRCPVCGADGGHARLAVARASWRRASGTVARCRECAALIVTGAHPTDAVYDDAYVVHHIEQRAGIEAIAGVLAIATHGPGARMLDVGCGYGFGVDLGDRLRRWHSTGVDPSVAAQKGRDELGIDIREGLLEHAIRPDERFDVVLVSELLEHLPDPRGFLTQVADRLADDGVVLVTTPDASVVRPDGSEQAALEALAIGDHRFLVDAEGLQRLLADAGLDATIRSSGSGLTAAAWRAPEGRAKTDPDATIALADLARYCRRRADEAAPGSPLALGMAMRAVKFSAYDGDLTAAADGIPALRDALVARYGIDLDDPASVSAVSAPPAIVGPAGYFAGIIAAYVTNDLDAADAYFAASAAAGRAHLQQHGTYTDPEMARFEAQSCGERLILAARRDRAAVPAARRAFDAAADRTGLDAMALEEFHRRADELMAVA